MSSSLQKRWSRKLGVTAQRIFRCASYGIRSFILSYSSIFLQDRISALEREQALKAGTQQTQDDTPVPHPKRPDLSRQYTVVLDDKPPTPCSASP